MHQKGGEKLVDREVDGTYSLASLVLTETFAGQGRDNVFVGAAAVQLGKLLGADSFMAASLHRDLQSARKRLCREALTKV